LARAARGTGTAPGRFLFQPLKPQVKVERAGPQGASMDDWAESGEEVERRLTAREMAADPGVLPLHTHAQAGTKGGRGKKASDRLSHEGVAGVLRASGV
jgi:hypothetical protein